MDAPDGLIITITDIRRAGFCPSGIREWFEGKGFDFRDVLKNGISATRLLATGDGRAERVVASVIRRG
jgi:hypothetical protein